MVTKIDILKSNIILGVSQVIQMLTTIVRAKLIAIFLGSTGIAFNAIFQSLLLMIYNVASCGLMQSGVREISQASAVGSDSNSLSEKYSVFHKLIVSVALLGSIVCIILAYPISLASFGNSDYVFSFVLLGIGVFFYILTHGEMTVLQGTRSLRRLAISSIIGSVLSVIVGIPCYYYFGVNGIVISIIVGYIVFWLTYRYHRQKIPNLKRVVSISLKDAFRIGKPMLSLGLVLMVGTTMISGFSYLTNISIRAIGTLNDLGLYQGVSAIATQSIVIVVAVLASDFFPRLSVIVDDTAEHNNLINQQLNVVLSVISAIVVIIICLPKLIISVLLTDEFLQTVGLLQLLAMALVFRGVWITMSYVILAHGDRKRYFIYDAFLGNGFNYLINILAYMFGGLFFLGVSSILGSIIISMILMYVVKRHYMFRMDKSTKKIMIIYLTLIALTFCLYQIDIVYSIVPAIITIGYSCYNVFSGVNVIRIIKNKI